MELENIEEEFPLPEIPITIKVVLSRTVTVKAFDYETALNRVKEQFENEEIVLDYEEDYCYNEID